METHGEGIGGALQIELVDLVIEVNPAVFFYGERIEEVYDFPAGRGVPLF